MMIRFRKNNGWERNILENIYVNTFCSITNNDECYIIQLLLNLVALLADIILRENFSKFLKYTFLSPDRVFTKTCCSLVFILILLISPDSTVSAFCLGHYQRVTWRVKYISLSVITLLMNYIIYIDSNLQYIKLAICLVRAQFQIKYIVYNLSYIFFLRNTYTFLS